MTKRFVLPILLLAAAGCAHRDTLPETTATPTYRPEDVMEAAAAYGGRRNLDERVAVLESEVKAMRIELSRVSGATQRLEARQLQTAGVTSEPKSKAATPLGKTAKRKPEKEKAPEPAAAPVDPRDPWAAPAPESAKADETAPPDAAHADHHAAAPDAAAKNETAANALPAPDAAPPAAAQAAGFGLQLAAFGSVQRTQAGWEELKSRGGPLLADLLPKREEISLGSKTLYRLKAGPLPDRASAQKRCDALKAQAIACIVAPFSGDWPSS